MSTHLSYAVKKLSIAVNRRMGCSAAGLSPLFWERAEEGIEYGRKRWGSYIDGCDSHVEHVWPIAYWNNRLPPRIYHSIPGVIEVVPWHENKSPGPYAGFPINEIHRVRIAKAGADLWKADKEFWNESPFVRRGWYGAPMVVNKKCHCYDFQFYGTGFCVNCWLKGLERRSGVRARLALLTVED